MVKKVISTVITVGVIASLYMIAGCPIKAVTGISCAGCGMTRALISAATGHFRKAFYYHPLFWAVPIGFLVFLLRERIPKAVLRALSGITVVVFLTVYIYRMLDIQNTVVTAEIHTGWIYIFVHKLFGFDR